MHEFFIVEFKGKNILPFHISGGSPQSPFMIICQSQAFYLIVVKLPGRVCEWTRPSLSACLEHRNTGYSQMYILDV